MQLVEQHVISTSDPRFQSIDEMAFASKNLWNLANYSVRQSFIFEHTYLNNTAVYHLVKSAAAYKALPRKVSNQVLIQLDEAWTAFFEEVEASGASRAVHRTAQASQVQTQNAGSQSARF